MKRKDGQRNRPGQGRPKERPNAKRHNVMIDSEVWEYLNRNKQASAEIERLARIEMEKQEAAE